MFRNIKAYQYIEAKFLALSCIMGLYIIFHSVPLSLKLKLKGQFFIIKVSINPGICIFVGLLWLSFLFIINKAEIKK